MRALAIITLLWEQNFCIHANQNWIQRIKETTKSVEMSRMLFFFSSFENAKKNPKHGESYVRIHFLLLSNKKKWQSFHIQAIPGINVAEKKIYDRKSE